MYDNTLYLFWSDQRDGNYEIYLSKGENTTITLGDVNQDLSIDILDIVLVVNFILDQQNPDNAQFFASDLNGDSIINIQDIILMVELIINNDYNIDGDMNSDSQLNILDVLLVINIIIGS